DQQPREKERAQRVESRRRLDRRLGNEAPHEDAGEPDPGGADDEEPPPREILDEQAGEHEPEAAADAEDRGDRPDPAADLLARELVEDDREREREDRAAEALDAA